MRTNKFSIGRLREVHVSSIVKWGDQANFNLVCYLFIFFLRKDFTRIKTLTSENQQTKQK